MFTMPQVVAHLVGDYLLQSHWMATNKQRKEAMGWVAVTAHALCYTLPFLFLTQSWIALAIICGTHLLIDHFKVAAIVGWLKNFLAPPSQWKSWSESKSTGYTEDVPAFLSVWLLIITDNVLHILINGVALHFWG